MLCCLNAFDDIAGKIVSQVRSAVAAKALSLME